MEYNKILNTLAPCGLNCLKCMARIDGDIVKHSSKLLELLGSFDKYAEKFSGFNPVFKNYPQFKKMLTLFTQGDCNGCRNGSCKMGSCNVITCHKEKNVDFCFQCDEFPCDKSNLDPDLKQRWITMNNRMKDIGINAYFEESQNSPRYK